jgi:hypothetical protein
MSVNLSDVEVLMRKGFVPKCAAQEEGNCNYPNTQWYTRETIHL